MSIGPQRPAKGGSSSNQDPRLDTLMASMPKDELFIMNSSQQFQGIGFKIPDMELANSVTGIDSTGNWKAFTFSPLAQQLISFNSESMVKGLLGIEVPTSLSELSNDSGYITAEDLPENATQVNTDWNSTSGRSQLLNKPTLAPVALSGDYNDLTNKPTIPVVNYPVVSVNGKVGAVSLTAADIGAIGVGASIPYSTLTGRPDTYAPSAHTHPINDISGLQAALDQKLGVGSTIPYTSLTGTPAIPTNTNQLINGSGYITNAALSGYATTSSLAGYTTFAQLASATSGLRKVETFLGTSDASGNFTITFANTYTTPPDVQPQIIGGTFNQQVRVVSVSNTGCVVQAAQRNIVTLLGLEVLLGATVNLVGASVTVQITARN